MKLWAPNETDRGLMYLSLEELKRLKIWDGREFRQCPRCSSEMIFDEFLIESLS